jgi:hypothetical protein
MSPIITDNVVGDAEHVHGLFDELNCFHGCDEGSWLHFDPFCECVHCDKDVCEATLCFLKRTYQI